MTSSATAGLPIALDGIIAKALAKDLSTRYQHVDDVPADLNRIDSDSTGRSRISAKTGSGQTITRTTHQNRIWRLVATFMAGLILAGFTLWFALRPPQSPVNRWNISLPESAAMAPIGNAPLAVGRPALAISPGGRH